MNTILTQTIGFAGVFIFLASYQIKSNRLLYFTQCIGCSMFCLQFFMLGGYGGCLNLALIICRNAMLMKYDEWSFVRNRLWVPLFSLISMGIMLTTWTGGESVFPFISMVSGTMGYWTNNARYIRMSCLVCCSPSWIVYDIIIRSWGGVLNESIGILSIIISICRFGWNNMGNADFGKEPEPAAEERAA